MSDDFDNHFPVERRPPLSHFWPKNAQKRHKTDLHVRRIGKEIIRTAPHLTSPRYLPAVLSLARLTRLIDRAYEVLENRELVTVKGELCPSLDTFRSLVRAQAELLKSLGLMPTSVLPNSNDHALDALFERIERMRAKRQGEELVDGQTDKA